MSRIDTSIYNNLQPTVKLQTPFELQQGYQQIQQGQNQNRLANMQFQEAERVGAERNALAGIAQQHGNNPEAYGNALMQGGYFKQAQDYAKQQNDAAMSGVELKNKQLTGQKMQGEITQAQKERSAAELGSLINDPQLSHDKVLASIQKSYSAGDIDEAGARQMIDVVRQQDPAQLKPFLNQILMGVMKPKDQVDLGFKERDFRRQSANDLIQPDGSINEPLVGAKSRVAQAGAIQSFGAPTAVTDRTGKQIMVSAGNRGDIKELPYSPPVKQNKPLPVGALKLRVESQEMADIAGDINTRLTGVESRIATGKLDFGPMSNLTNNVLNLAGRSTENSRNFASFKAELEKLRNDSLRLNKGVQTDGDSQRAWNEILENITDTKLVQQRLAEVKILNERAKNLRLMEVDTINRNYGVENEQPAGNAKPPSDPKAASAYLSGAKDKADFTARVRALKAKGWTEQQISAANGE